MPDTKERLLLTALRLFAQDSYEAVSVSAIAGELGMTKGTLYKHYKNKRDIFDCIVERTAIWKICLVK
ncbi:MAG: TetR/AcrR family transcriptional regulator [Thermotaleaceae bacterium]